MGRDELIFRGNVCVYLQGKQALQPVDIHQENSLNYYIGSPVSKIHLHDFREAPNDAARRAIIGVDGYEFADVFNQPAWVEIKHGLEGIVIELYESTEEADCPTLWLGVLHEKVIPVHQFDWKTFKSIGPSEIAFASLVR